MEFIQEQLVFTGEDFPMANLMLSVLGAFEEFKGSLIRSGSGKASPWPSSAAPTADGRRPSRPKRVTELGHGPASGTPKSVLASDCGISS